MKLNPNLFFVVFLFIFASVSASAEEIPNPGIEQQIRALDLLQAEAMQTKGLRYSRQSIGRQFSR